MISSLEFPYAHGGPAASGVIRSTPEDFFVDEIGVAEADGEGEHLLLHVEKRDANTEWAARRIARLAGVRPGDVSYAGLKDRVAVTRQWFTLLLGKGETPDWSELEADGIRVLSAERHRRKLRRGALKGNRFRLVIRRLDGDREGLEARLRAVAECGVPNYFGEQRFGREGGNLENAEAMFGGKRVHDRHKRGLYLSAARSHLFNLVLAARVEAGSWNRALPGEALVLAGSHSHFVGDEIDAEIERRLGEFDIDPSGPLWGRGEAVPHGEAQALEASVLEPWTAWRDGLERAGMKQERRALRLTPAELSWGFPADDVLELAFRLPAGCYATTVLRELVRTEED